MIWVKQARVEHMTFVDAMRNRGVEVVFLRQLLAETLANTEARRWLLEARINDNTVGVGLADDLLSHLLEIDADLLSTILIGGMSRAELPVPTKGVLAPMLGPDDFILAPLPNHIFTRDTICWIYGGVTLNPMHWPARRLDVAAVFQDFGGADQRVIGATTPEALGKLDLAPGSMGPKVGAAAAFVTASHKLAGLGQLTDAHAILEGLAGTRVLPA